MGFLRRRARKVAVYWSPFVSLSKTSTQSITSEKKLKEDLEEITKKQNR
jgi:hypothetical protein